MTQPGARSPEAVASRTTPPPSRGRIVARVLVFLGIFVGLQLGWQQLQGTAVQYAYVNTLTATPAAAVLNVLLPGNHIHADGLAIQGDGGRVNIINGCEGVEALFLLAGALLSSPGSRASRVLGLAVGTVLVVFVNQARVALLYYAWCRSPPWFYVLHSTVTPIALILIVAAYFYVWTARSTRIHAA
jgi:exosortase family protein XrtM